MRASTFSAGASSATTSEAPTRGYVRLRLSGQEGVGRRHGQGADTLSTEHEPAARCPAASAQPDAAGLDHVLQVRLLTRDLQLPEVLPVETGHQVARAQAPAHGLEEVAPTLRQRPADRGVELFDPARVRAIPGAQISIPWPSTA